MSLPAAYTEISLAQFMHRELGPIVEVLGYPEPADSPGAYVEAVNDVCLALGVNDIGQAGDIRAVRVMARREAWSMAVKAFSTSYDFGADGGKYNQSQMFAQARKALELAIADCLALGLDGYSVSIQTLDYRHDPYNFPKAG